MAKTEELKEVLVQKPELKAGTTLKTLLSTNNVRARFEDMLGKKAGGFISSILSAAASNKHLATADPASVVGAAAIAASLDLPINQSLGFAYIVPYKGVAQFQLGWRGLVQLAMRSGQYRTMNATAIHEGQVVKNDPFTGKMEFKTERISDKIIGYLFYFQLINGFEKYTYWTKEEVEAHAKRYSQSYRNGQGPWKDDFDAMAIKTVVKTSLGKWGILSIDLQTAIEKDQGVISEDLSKVDYIDAVTENEGGAA